jgi:CheY-like chemotaxis protein
MTAEKTGLRVLVIEDEGMVAMLLVDMLTGLGHRVVGTAGRLDKAAVLVAETAIDFAILDVNLDGQHSYSIAASLKERGIPFVFATGYGGSGLRSEWKETPVLQKPFTERDLQQVIRKAWATA